MGNLGAPKVGETWYQLAQVTTPNWKALPKDTRIEVSTTDNQGCWQKSISMRHDVFEETFFPANEKYFLKTVYLASQDPDDNGFEVIFLNFRGEEIGKTTKLAPRIIEANFMHQLVMPD